MKLKTNTIYYFRIMEENRQLLEYMESFLTERRKDLFERVLDQRTDFFTIATQDVYQLHNTSAVIRSCDVFGIQNVHVVEELHGKRIDREIAMGAQKWVDVNRYTSTQDCLEHLKRKGYRIVATSPHKGAPLEDFDISERAAFFFGTEKDGLTEDVMQEADAFVQIPMVGFTESLNISVSAAIILQNVTSRLRNTDLNWKLSQEEKKRIRLDWAKKSIKSSDELIKRFQASQ